MNWIHKTYLKSITTSFSIREKKLERDGVVPSTQKIQKNEKSMEESWDRELDVVVGERWERMVREDSIKISV